MALFQLTVVLVFQGVVVTTKVRYNYAYVVMVTARDELDYCGICQDYQQAGDSRGDHLERNVVEIHSAGCYSCKVWAFYFHMQTLGKLFRWEPEWRGISTRKRLVLG
jgi:hypothetical protein